MTPYYDDGQITLYHGDCREVLPSLPRDSVDLIVTDPPYGVNWQSNHRTNKLARINGDGDKADELVEAGLAASLRLLRSHRHLYVFGRPDLSGLPIGTTAELVWDKAMLGMGDLSLPWGPSWEPITFGVYVSRPSGRAAGDGRLAARLRRGSIVRVPRANAGQLEDRHSPHATPKPVVLLRQLIESSSMLGETVLDPFAGRGSTLLAAQAEGRQAIGMEIDERHCEKAAGDLAALAAPR
ncbi:MAG TPA: DNA methyltransferase [Acidimicrobiales bacterium]|nr:DNA methyltransferase [Acidimicrobiales bacterium]